MADISAAAHPGPGHLLGHVLRDGQTFSMAAYHVCILNVYVDVQLLFILCVSFFYYFCGESLFSLGFAGIIDSRQDTSQCLLHNISYSINSDGISQITQTMALAFFLL